MKKDINSLSPEARAIIRAQVSRRSVLAGVGAVSAAGLLAACGTGSSTGAEVAVDVSDTEKFVCWASWPLFLDFYEVTKVFQTLAAFE
jgi:spermidine/putrescine transport system substrate-binding protein